MAEAIEVQRLVATLEANFNKYDKALNKALGNTDRTFRKIERSGARMETALNRIAPQFKGLIASLGVGIGTAGLVTFGKSLLNAASDAEEMESKFNAVFKGLSADVSAWANEHSRLVGRSALDLKEYLASLQDTFVPLGFARSQGAELSKQLVQLAIDVASFSNASEPGTINAFTSAIVGNHEAVRRFGIVITQATLNQELMRMGIKGGASAATEQEKALARLNLIVNSTKDAHGDAARTSGSFANQTKALEGAWKDLKTELGSFMRGPGTDVLTFLADATRATTRFLDSFRATYRQAPETIDRRIAQLENTITNYSKTTRGVIESVMPEGMRLGGRGKQEMQAELDLLKRMRRAMNDLDENGPQTVNFDRPTPGFTPPDKNVISRADEVTDALTRELQALGMNNEQQRIAAELARAGVDAKSQQGRAIADLVRQIEAETRANEVAAARSEDYLARQQAAMQSAQALGDTVEAAMLSIVDGTTDAEAALKRLALQLGIAAAKAAFLGQGPLAGLFGPATLPGGSISPFNAARAKAGFAGLYADGGRIPAGKWGWTGEKGPEIVTGPATVTPMGKIGGDTFSPVINIDARGSAPGVETAIRREVDAALTQFSRFQLVDRLRDIRADPLARG